MECHSQRHHVLQNTDRECTCLKVLPKVWNLGSFLITAIVFFPLLYYSSPHPTPKLTSHSLSTEQPEMTFSSPSSPFCSLKSVPLTLSWSFNKLLWNEPAASGGMKSPGKGKGGMRPNGTEPKVNGENEQHMRNVGGREERGNHSHLWHRWKWREAEEITHVALFKSEGCVLAILWGCGGGSFERLGPFSRRFTMPRISSTLLREMLGLVHLLQAQNNR